MLKESYNLLLLLLLYKAGGGGEDQDKNVVYGKYGWSG